MVQHSQFASGWIDTSVHEFLEDIEDLSSSMAYSLITCLDSSFDVSAVVSTSAGFKAIEGKCQQVGQGILLPTRLLMATDRRDRVFFGFDEVWFFPHAEVTPKPADLVITGPNKIAEELLAPLSAWMDANGCSLGLGDGIGMNYCAKVRGVARHLVHALSVAAASNEKQAGLASTA